MTMKTMRHVRRAAAKARVSVREMARREGVDVGALKARGNRKRTQATTDRIWAEKRAPRKGNPRKST